MSEEAGRKWTWQEIDRAILERGEMVYVFDVHADTPTAGAA